MENKFANESELETLKKMINDISKMGVEKGLAKPVADNKGSVPGMNQFNAVAKRLMNSKDETVSSAAKLIHETVNGNQYKNGMLPIDIYTNMGKEFKKLYSHLRAKKNA
jgi:hypothetical protein